MLLSSSPQILKYSFACEIFGCHLSNSETWNAKLGEIKYCPVSFQHFHDNFSIFCFNNVFIFVHTLNWIAAMKCKLKAETIINQNSTETKINQNSTGG